MGGRGKYNYAQKTQNSAQSVFLLVYLMKRSSAYKNDGRLESWFVLCCKVPLYPQGIWPTAFRLGNNCRHRDALPKTSNMGRATLFVL